MASNLGCFVSKYHGVAKERVTIGRFVLEIAAMQKYFLLQFPAILC
jgi:hypothetical protein